jgi:UDP-N-acetylglucosamine--N-acetylmuramyl-(pentapeptide) pyrophosphoryl-undecaprenol N-acetylglucosamine transferase
MRILVTGGGTGGHIYPALAFVDYVQMCEPNAEFMYVGAKRGLENKIVPTKDIPFETIEIQGFKRSLSPYNIKTVYLFVKSVFTAKKILKKFRPDVVIGTGGYVSGAVVYAAAKMKIPTIIHEQNSVPGVTNKFLSKYVTKVGTSFSGVESYFPKEKVIHVGNPRAQEVATVAKSSVLSNYQLEPKRKTVLIFGGSQGALKINNAFVEAMDEFSKKDYQVLYASGERYYASVSEKSKQLNAKNISIQPYIHDMAEVMVNSTLLVGRAGATSIAELTALGLPAVLIPSPYVTNDHQTKNAQSLVNVGAVEMISDAELTGEKLIQVIDSIMNDPEKQERMARASKEEGIPDASKRLYNVVKEII